MVGAQKLIEAVVLPDGSAFGVMSLPLPDDHWLYGEHEPIPPLEGAEAARDTLTKAGRYAVRGATMRGKVMDFDPDALVMNLVSALVRGYDPDEL